MTPVGKEHQNIQNSFKQAYSESPPTIEFLLKEFSDIVMESVEYGPETMEPFIDSFIYFMKYDVKRKTTYLKKIFESIEPAIIRAMQSNQWKIVNSYLEQLSGLEKTIKRNQNFCAARIYITALRETLQDLLRCEKKEKDKSIWTILSMTARIFSDFLEFNGAEIQKAAGNRFDVLSKIIEESLYMGYNLINRNELYFFDKYLEMLESMYWPMDNSHQCGLKEMDYGDIKKRFFCSLFRIGVYALMKKRHEFVTKLLSRDEIGMHITEVNKKLHEDFIGAYKPEKYVELALRNPFELFGPIGEIASERDVVQFYLLIRSKAFFKQMKRNNPKIWNYSSLKLREHLKGKYEWIFFEKEVPEEFSPRWKVSFVSDFIREIESLKTRKFKSYEDLPYHVGVARRFEKGNDLLQQALDSFTNTVGIYQEAFGGALEQFLEVTIHFLEKISNKWEEEKEKVERSFPISEDRKEEAKERIGEALRTKGIFREAVQWTKSDQQTLEKTEMLDEILLKYRIDAVYLKNLPLSVSFENLGEIAAHEEDKEIMNRISEKNIKKEKAHLTINVKTIRRFLEILECETIILVTGRNVIKDLMESEEIKYRRRSNKAYEVSIGERRKAIVYWSNIFEDRTLIFAKDQFFGISYLERESVEIRSPEKKEISEGEDREDFQMIVISQKRGLRFLDFTKAVIVEHTSN